jgi:hypothetical protein
MGRKAMSQHVYAHLAPYATAFTCIVKHLLHGANGYRRTRLHTFKEEKFGSINAPISPQFCQQLLRKDDIAILFAFAGFYPDDHSFAIDVLCSEVGKLTHSQSGGIQHAQNNPMFGVVQGID